MKILISTTQPNEIPPDLPPQNILTFNLMPGSEVFLSGFNDKGELWFTKRVQSGGNMLLDLPIKGIDWENTKAKFAAEINALTLENAELRKKLIMSPPIEGIILPGNGDLKNP